MPSRISSGLNSVERAICRPPSAPVTQPDVLLGRNENIFRQKDDLGSADRERNALAAAQGANAERVGGCQRLSDPAKSLPYFGPSVLRFGLKE